jgi:putative ABC transport system permease protein
LIGLALRGLATNRLRGVLTALAVLLGVAMVSGTLMLSDSVNRSFDDIFAAATEGIDVSVRANVEIEAGFELPESGTALPEDLLAQVEAVDGVEQASGAIGDSISIAILDEEGDRIGPPQGGPPHIVNSVQPEPFTPFSYPQGGPPETDEQVAIDSFTAEEEGYEIGQLIPITGAEGLSEYELAGISRFGSGVALGGATLAEFTLPEAQRITGKQGEFDEISVETVEGVSPEELRDRIAAALPPEAVEVKTGEQIAEDDSEDIKEGFGFLTTALLVFAGITVFVGAFLIFNTFAITVAQRTREFGMLRTLGASSRQVLTTVIAEAAALGLVASVVGILAGAGFVELLLAAFKALGFELPQSGLQIGTTTIIAALAVGMFSTLASALIPALRATGVSPLEALSDQPGGESEGGSRRRTVIAATLTVVGILVILLGLFSGGEFGQALAAMGLGLVLLFVGIAMLGGKLISPLASLVGRPIERLRGVTGRLARENTLRNPSRTATTSSALMIGVALVVFVLMLGSAITKSVGDALDKTFTGDVAIFNVDGFSPIPAAVAPAVEEVDGVLVASPIAASAARVEGVDGNQLVTGLDPPTLGEAAQLDWVDGDDATLAGLSENGALVESSWAEDNNIAVGDELTLTTPTGEQVSVEVEGSVRDRVALLVDSVALPIELLRTNFDTRQDAAILATFDQGADFDLVDARVEELLAARFPNAEARSQQQLKDEQEEQINGLVLLIYVLLTLAVILSLVGVVNTLVLTVLERKRELAMLRSIGASRSQVRRMVRYESLITAMIGAIVGAAIGIAIAVAAITALESEGLVLSFPIIGIIVVLVLAGIAGVLAGIWPARRASRIEVIEALQYE